MFATVCGPRTENEISLLENSEGALNDALFFSERLLEQPPFENPIYRVGGMGIPAEVTQDLERHFPVCVLLWTAARNVAFHVATNARHPMCQQEFSYLAVHLGGQVR